MSQTTVCAFQPIPELNNETGFVTCDEDLAKKLISSEMVDDPTIGAIGLREIQSKSYETKVITAVEEPEKKFKRNKQIRKDVA